MYAQLLITRNCVLRSINYSGIYIYKVISFNINKGKKVQVSYYKLRMRWAGHVAHIGESDILGFGGETRRKETAWKT
jgi:hypothetical protein